MSRGKAAPKRVSMPDPVHNSELLGRFINFLMERGKKSIAQKIVYDALAIVKEKKKEDPLKIFEQVINTAKPQVEVRSKRVGGANYQVPMPVVGNRQDSLAFRWIIIAAKSRKGPMSKKLAQEYVISAENNLLEVVKNKSQIDGNSLEMLQSLVQYALKRAK